MILKLKRTPGLYLVGFMASGKTTIGRLLADELGWDFADLDEDIVAAHGAEHRGDFRHAAAKKNSARPSKPPSGSEWARSSAESPWWWRWAGARSYRKPSRNS